MYTCLHTETYVHACNTYVRKYKLLIVCNKDKDALNTYYNPVNYNKLSVTYKFK